ncbi:MAG TPA: hypothetical protein VMU31_12265 [Rhizomicrobium sp.]|nr:hypothetical protein [Rhizomicrobium sp.]
MSDKSVVLQNFLGALPEQAAAKLAHAIEMDRMMDGKALPHDAILMGLRPSLRQLHGSARTKTPMRLFCQPFEDLLTSEPRRAKQKGILARMSVAPVFTWLSGVLLPNETNIYCREIKSLVLANDDEAALAKAIQFWAVAGRAMRDALATDAGVKAARKILKPDEIEDAREIALLIIEGEEMLRVQATLPKPPARMTEEILHQLRDSYDALIARNPDAAPYVAVVAMNRLQRPCEALRLPLMVSRQTGDALISKTDMGLVGEILFGRMDMLQAAILATRTAAFDAETLLAQVASFSDLSSSVVKEIEVRRNGEWGQRLLKDRAAVGNVMDAFMERAVKEVSAALPIQKGATDVTRQVAPEKRASALNYARLVGGARNFAAAASFAAKHKTVSEEITHHLRRYVEDAVRELKGEGERRVAAEFQLNYCAELAQAVISPEEAELIRRRVRAAQSAAA